MDRRILIVIVCCWLIAAGTFFYKKVYAASGVTKPKYSMSIKNKRTFVGSIDTFIDVTPGASSWSWDFGDNEFSNEKNATHVYTEAGERTIRLEVYGDDFGTISSSDVKIQVVEAAPAQLQDITKPAILGPDKVNVGEDVQYTCSVSAKGYSWSVANDPQYGGNIQTGSAATFAFKTPGSKKIRLSLTGGDQGITKDIFVIAKVAAPPASRPARPHQQSSGSYVPKKEPVEE